MKKYKFFVAAILLVSLLSACSKSSTPTTAPNNDPTPTATVAPTESVATSTPTPTHAAEATIAPVAEATPTPEAAPEQVFSDRELRIAIRRELTTLEPTQVVGGTDYLLLQSLFDSPWDIDIDFNIHYRLVTKYEISDDGLNYTLTLREGAIFQNGEPVTAEDVAYSAELSREAPLTSEWGSYIDTATVVDASTVRITLTSPYAPLINSLADLFIVPKAAHQAAGQNFGYEPIGGGPYKLISYSAGDRIVLEAFEDYYNPANIKNVTYKFLGESSTVSVALETGEIDFSSAFSKTDLPHLSSLDTLQLIQGPASSWDGIVINTAVTPYDNPLVRQAFNYAIDRESLVIGAKNSLAVAGSSPWNQLVFGYKETPGFPYNPEKAAQLLAEAGYPNGEGFPEFSIITVPGSIDGPQIIQQNLKDLGIETTIEELDMSLLFDYLINGTAVLTYAPFGMGADAAFYASLLVTNGGANWTNYSNPEVDELFAKAAETSDPSSRKEYYGKILDIYQEEAPYAVLYYDISAALYSIDLDLSAIENFSGVYADSPYNFKWK
jgi:ABC-type transport system substrate-binding protein